MNYSAAFRFSGSLILAFIFVLSGISHGQKADVSPPKPQGKMVRLGDFGSDDLAFLAVPNTPPTLGLVLVPDSYGLDDFTKSEANRLAAQGYLVLAIDIYNGHVTTDPGDLANLTANLNAGTVMKTVDAGIRFFHESPRFRAEHVVAMGWGAGATYVFQAARENKTLDGAVMFYGPVETNLSVIGKFAAPLCAVYPEGDSVTPHESVQTFQHAMKDAGNTCEAWFIDACRGWSNPKSKTYNPGEDKEAWKVATPFLVRIGSTPVKPKDNSILDKAANGIKSIFNLIWVNSPPLAACSW